MFATIRQFAELYTEQGGDLGIGSITEWPDHWDKSVNVVVGQELPYACVLGVCACGVLMSVFLCFSYICECVCT